MSLVDIPAERLEPAFDEMFGVNVKGDVVGAKAALSRLRETRGSIVFTRSMAGLHASFGGFLYVTAKRAASVLTRQLAVELAPDVRVNAVAPGYVPRNLVGLETLAQGASNVMLASRDSAAAMTGTVVLADSGLSIHRAHR